MFLLRQYRSFPTIFILPAAVLDLPLQPSYGCTSAYLTSTLLQYRYCRTYQHRTVLYYRYIQLPYFVMARRARPRHSHEEPVQTNPGLDATGARFIIPATSLRNETVAPTEGRSSDDDVPPSSDDDVLSSSPLLRFLPVSRITCTCTPNHKHKLRMVGV